MALTLEDDLAILSGVVTVEEAEPLLLWLKDHPAGRVDLAAVTHLHTAALQLLMATAPLVERPFTEPFLLRWVGWGSCAASALDALPVAAGAEPTVHVQKRARRAPARRRAGSRRS